MTLKQLHHFNRYIPQDSSLCAAIPGIPVIMEIMRRHDADARLGIRWDTIRGK